MVCIYMYIYIYIYIVLISKCPSSENGDRNCPNVFIEFLRILMLDRKDLCLAPELRADNQDRTHQQG